MRPDVDKVDLWAIRELPDAAPLNPDAAWEVALCNPATGISYRANQELIAAIISNFIGSGIVTPDRVYRIGVSLPAGATVSVVGGKGRITDPYLDGKVFSMFRRGLECSMKGVEWDNTVPGGGIDLLQDGDIFIDGDIITLLFQPQISQIISTPDAIARFTSGVQLINSDTILTPSTYRKLLVLTSGYNITLGADYPENVLCCLTTNQPTNKQSTISAPAGQTISWNGTTVQSVWVGKNERVSFVRAGNTWYVAFDTLGYDRVGHIVPGRLPGANQIIGQGQRILRTDYPRVLDYINRLNAAYPGVVQSAADWGTSSTFWGFGNGITDIQVPDLRGVGPRWLDLGAGVDQDRNVSGLGFKPGSYQADRLKDHVHQTNIRTPGAGPGLAGTSGNGGPNEIGTDGISGGDGGGTETRGKNSGELPLIYI